jgi:hypothetical protein
MVERLVRNGLGDNYQNYVKLIDSYQVAFMMLKWRKFQTGSRTMVGRQTVISIEFHQHDKSRRTIWLNRKAYIGQLQRRCYVKGNKEIV